MIIIGEKINGFIRKTLEAIEAKDETYIRELAQRQTDSGADYLDVCAGTSPESERDTLTWLIDVIQDTVDTPLCIDSSDPQVLLDMMALASRPGLINSVSLEEGKCEAILPVIAETEWGVIALTCDNNGIPDEPHTKAQIAFEIIRRANAAGISNERIYIDPLVSTLATRQDSLPSFIQTIAFVKKEHPTVHFTSGLSNISYGMPYRKAINMQFLALAMAAGMDSAILDPTSPDIQATLHAVAALTGQDEYCVQYLKAFRAGLFGSKPA